MEDIKRLFSLSNIICAANAFSSTYQLSYYILDAHLNIRYQSGGKYLGCPICSFLKKSKGKEIRKDLTFHRKGCQQARTLNGWYIYACPLGVHFFVVPVWDSGEIVAYITAGPIFLRGLKDKNIFDALKRRNAPAELRTSILGDMRAIPFLMLSEIESLARKLQMMTRCLERSVLPQPMEALKISAHFFESEDPHYSDDLKKDLLGALQAANQPLSNKILLEILDQMYIAHRGIASNMHSDILDVMTLLTCYALSSGVNFQYLDATSYATLSKVYQIQSFYEMSTWAIKTMNFFIEQIQTTGHTEYGEAIYQAMQYISHEYMRKITLEEVSGYVYLSPTYFSKLFHQQTKCSFNTYLNQMRIEKSKHFLFCTQESVTEIAKRVGFDDQSYFTKVFKRIIGVTPGQYRSVVKNKP